MLVLDIAFGILLAGAIFFVLAALFRNAGAALAILCAIAVVALIGTVV